MRDAWVPALKAAAAGGALDVVACWSRSWESCWAVLPDLQGKPGCMCASRADTPRMQQHSAACISAHLQHAKSWHACCQSRLPRQVLYVLLHGLRVAARACNTLAQPVSPCSHAAISPVCAPFHGDGGLQALLSSPEVDAVLVGLLTAAGLSEQVQVTRPSVACQAHPAPLPAAWWPAGGAAPSSAGAGYRGCAAPRYDSWWCWCGVCMERRGGWVSGWAGGRVGG